MTTTTQVSHLGRTLVPMARSFLLRLPGEAGAFVWNRPVGLRVEEPSGSRTLRITDPTRRIQLGLLAAGLAAALLVRRARRRRTRRRLFGKRR